MEPNKDEVVDYTTKILQMLVDDPDAVKVDMSTNEQGIELVAHVNPKDAAFVIGKSGSTIMSIRRLLRVLGSKHKAFIAFKLDEEHDKK